MVKENVQEAEVKVEAVNLLPPVDIIDAGEAVLLSFEVPGANSGSVEVEVQNGILTMKAASSLKRHGRSVVFKRSFRLSDDAAVKEITAKSEDGILTLTIPKGERARVHRVAVE